MREGVYLDAPSPPHTERIRPNFLKSLCRAIRYPLLASRNKLRKRYPGAALLSSATKEPSAVETQSPLCGLRDLCAMPLSDARFPAQKAELKKAFSGR